MSKIRTRLFGVIVAFVVFLAAAIFSLSLPTARKAMAATGDILYLAPVYDTDGKVTFDKDGNVVMQEKTLADGTYNVVTNTDEIWGEGTTATADENGEYWYIVNTTLTMNTSVAVDGITVVGKVRLILCDGCTLNMTFDTLTVSEGNELTVYGQENGTGTLKANTNNSSGANGAGIGGNANNPNAGKITVNGGVISTRGATNSGAGIGGGNGGNGGEITVNGGTVTATGGSYYGAGIGGSGGGDSGTIVINGGTVTATAGDYSAAIGSSSHYSNKVYGDCSVVRIYGGSVTANAKDANAAAIGGSYKGVLDGVEIYGGEITTTGGSVGIGVGSAPVKGENEPYVTIYGGKINTTRIGQADSYTNNTLPKVNINIHGGEVTASTGIGSAKGDSGQITITGGKVVAYGGASNGYGHAAIGGGRIDMEIGGSGYVTISGGYVEAYGGGTRELGGGAGIGGAYKGHGIVRLSGACIIAEGGPGADGIGDGDDADPNGVHLEFGGSVGGGSGSSGPAPTPDDPDLEESQTTSTGAIVFATGITGYSEENAADYTGIICRKYGETDVYAPSDYIFVDDIRIPSGYQLTIEEDKSLTLVNGKTLTVEGELIVQGTLSLNNGAKIVKGAEFGAVSSMQDGYRFDGWYTDEALSVPFVFGESVTEKITLYPKFVQGITECNPDNGNIEILGVSVEDIVFYGGKYNGYTGTPMVYVTDFSGTYYTAGVSLATHYEDERGEILDDKLINAGNYALVFTFTDTDDTDSVNCTGSISYPFTIEKYTLTLEIDNQILDTTDDDLSSLNKTLTITYMSGVSATHVAGYVYTVDFAWNSDRTGVILSNGRAVDENGVDKTDNITFIYTDALIMDYTAVTTTLSSSTLNISVPNKDKVTTHVGYGYIYANSTSYRAYADFCEWAYYTDSSYSVPLAESDLVGIYAQGNILTVTPEASQNAFTSNAFRLYYTITCNGSTTQSYYTIQRRRSTFTSIAVYKNGEEITGDEISAGSTATYTAKALDQYGYEMADKTVDWSATALDGVTFENGVLTVASGVSGTVTLTATSGMETALIEVKIGATVETEKAKLMGGSLTLGDKIAVHFYFTLDPSIVNDTGAYVLFTLADGSTKKVLVSEARVDDTTINGTTMYVFTCEVNAKEMTDRIFAKVVSGEYESEEVTYSVKQYADVIIANAQGAYDEETIGLVKAMLNYGAYAQTYFDYNVENLANADLTEEEKGVSAVTEESLQAYKPTGATVENYGSFVGSSLTLKTNVVLLAYFELEEGVEIGALKFTANGKEVAPVQEGSYYTIRLENIAASDLDEGYVFTATVGGDETQSVAFTCSSLSYCYSVVTNDSFPESLKDLVKAISLYNEAANKYAERNS